MRSMHFDRLMHSNALPHARDAESPQTRGQKPGEGEKHIHISPFAASLAWRRLSGESSALINDSAHPSISTHPESLAS